jgi:hypothetical protein
VRGEHLGEVHPVELIARQDQDVLDSGLLKVPQILSNKKSIISLFDRGHLVWCHCLRPSGES